MSPGCLPDIGRIFLVGRGAALTRAGAAVGYAITKEAGNNEVTTSGNG